MFHIREERDVYDCILRSFGLRLEPHSARSSSSGCIPGLKLTFANLLLFVVGGFAGIGAAGYLVSLIFRHSEHSRLLGLLAWPIVVVGAAVGGTGFVWLKTHFAKRH